MNSVGDSRVFSGDVDTTSLSDGAILQYRSSDAKFVARTEIVTTTGTLTLNAGTF